MNEKDLLKLKQQIDDAKVKAGELRGRRDYLMQQLKKQHGCDSVEEAKKQISILEGQIAKINKEIKNGLDELEEQIHE